MTILLKDPLAKLIAFIFDRDKVANPLPAEGKRALRRQTEAQIRANHNCIFPAKGELPHD